MGLDAYVEKGEGGRLGSYGWYGSFRDTVCDYLEHGSWGYRFPRLMMHSDCGGEYSPEEAEELLKEIQIIKEELKQVKYPANTIGEVQYGKDGDFKFSDGIEYGIKPEGMFLRLEYPERVSKETRRIFEKYGKRINKKLTFKPEDTNPLEIHFDKAEIIGKDKSFKKEDDSGQNKVRLTTRDGKKIEMILSSFFVSKNMEFKYESADKVFEGTIDLLERLCKSSIELKSPIIFC